MTGFRQGNRTEPVIYATRRLDLAEIDAVGFDLDHTLAVYDDQAVNKLACDEARRYLVRGGYPSALTSEPFDNEQTPRGLGISLDNGHIVKLDANDQVSRARFGDRWLSQAEVDALNARGTDRFHHLNSPFDVPTGFMFSLLVSLTGDGAMDFPAVCTEVRQTLDRAHTRGNLKEAILSDTRRYVSPLPALHRAVRGLRDAGKRIFVVTNSEHSYTTAILDYLLEEWRHLMDVVCVSADKPGFFTGTKPGTPIEDKPVRIHSGGMAGELESLLGVSGQRILFVGDNPVSDTQSAKRFGWRTAQVLSELGDAPEGSNEKSWGSMLRESHRSTRLARQVLESADLYAERIETLLDIEADRRFEPTPGVLGAP